MSLATWQLILMVIDYTIKFAVIGVIPENRKPSSANAWLLVILLIPFLGLPIYFFLGSTFLSRRRHRIQREANAMLNDVHTSFPDYPSAASVSGEVATMAHLNRTLTGFPALDGHVKHLWSDYSATMRRLASTIDGATSHVHVEIYAMAWDKTTGQVWEAMERAVARGVKVRVLFDHIGSWKYPDFRTFKRRMTEAGIEWHMMLPLQPLRGKFRRPDLRNHRKLMVIDDEVAFMGSFNLIDRTYLMPGHVKHGRQWVDAFVELTGPIVASLESMFAVDWYTEAGEILEISAPHDPDPATLEDQNVLQLIPSGPGYTTEPNLRMFNTLIHHARHRLILCSPYFVPDDSMLEAITTACYRGVRVDLLVGEKADQFMVNHAQSAYYQQLLEAGVHIWQFPAPYVLHTKFAIADPVALTYPDAGEPKPGTARAGDVAKTPTESADLPRGASVEAHAATSGADHAGHEGGAGSEASTSGNAQRAPDAAHLNEIAIMGSSNMDMRSFSLNYENSLFILQGPLITDLCDLASAYLSVSRQLTLDEWKKRPWSRRYIDNVMKLTSALQ
ncbi:PLDc N-terminal domain-containing protein [Corynebacterium sp. CCUG 69979]|uniref:phospholipase D-like domain-containing protein n=1 Tax=Corynebacterium sp. CCUG 69979 TaxID=2823890 RepID=UPI00210D9C05|nr:phospholipase D-like domain-containing protein [Corynebacterium sp. CCUG 69979]MCQ4625576.1 PLDc N-terminal domain-containing protein [Corynebacterium sp. CCUG 69979]